MKTTNKKLHFFAINALVFCSFFLFTAYSISAQTTTLFSGDWADPSNWNNGVPTNGSIANINHNMDLDMNLDLETGTYTVFETGAIIDNSGGGTRSITIREDGILNIDGNVNIEGALTIRERGVLLVKSDDTMIVGSAEFRNFALITIEEFAVMIINGNLDMRNSNAIQLDGKLYVNGDIEARNTSSITGNGNIEATGNINFSNSANFFGNTTDCSPGPCEYGSGSGLPVELTEFKAAYTENAKVKIHWVTASEINNDFFILEQSKDGFIFNEVAKVQGNGTKSSRSEYVILDNAENEYTYYRLTQVDFNGDSKTYNPIALSPSFARTNDVTIYPNPALENQDIHIKHNSSDEEIKVELRDIRGKLLFEQIIQQASSDIILDKRLQTGIYFLNFKSASENSTEKLIVSN